MNDLENRRLMSTRKGGKGLGTRTRERLIWILTQPFEYERNDIDGALHCIPLRMRIALHCMPAQEATRGDDTRKAVDSENAIG